jgi:hypothetical protein
VTIACALGLFYVMKASAPGGQAVNDTLKQTASALPGGLSYFNPYKGRPASRPPHFLCWFDE